MRICYTQDYFVPLPDGHPFPMGKYIALYEILIREQIIRHEDVIEPHEADWSDLLLVHTPDYLATLTNGTMDRTAERRLGLPWSAALMRRSRLAVQGTIDAARMALDDGIAANLAGGTHHAFADHGEGYCVLNDVAVAVRVLQRSTGVRRALIIDLDVHQGNGTAAIFENSEEVFTFSIHGENNYPLRKGRSSRDIGLPDGAGDDIYLETLSAELPGVFAAARPDIVFYLAGVDLAAGDRYGRLALTREGVGARDRLVMERAHAEGVPAALVLSGGYARTSAETADLHAMAHRAGKHVFLKTI